MSTNQDKGTDYEDFSKEIFLMKNLKWSYNFLNRNITFDKDLSGEDICGISGQEHQIDIHLVSSKKPKVHLICECKAHSSGVEKTHATSFVTVINDIKKKHKDWKIIPVFAGEDGFQSGAWKILNYYKIIAFDMKDYRNHQCTLTMNISTRIPIFSKIEFNLENGNVVGEDALYFCDYVFDYVPLTWSIKRFEIIGKRNKIIDPIDFLDYKGKFHSGKKINNSNDIIEKNSGCKVIGFEGEIIGNKSRTTETVKDVFSSDIITNIRFGDDSIYKFYKDGTCVKIK